MKIFSLLNLLLLFFACNGQPELRTPRIGGPFENREFTFIGMPETIPSSDTTLGWLEGGQRLRITGTIFEPDGRTPAPDVILYYYHTDTAGYYRATPELDPRVARHGYLRGWVKTDEQGQYSIHTVRPAAYPSAREPAHIHPAIVEPGQEDAYYIDEMVFDDDPLLTTERRFAAPKRGGSGVLRILMDGDVQVAEHDIVLGRNIPHYPRSVSANSIGEDVFSFTPSHVWGPDAGTRACPVCKYGRYYGILYFVGNQPDWQEISRWLTYLERESERREGKLKVYFIYGNEHEVAGTRVQRLQRIGRDLNLSHLALTHVPSFTDRESEIYRNGIDPDLSSTLLIYRHGSIVDEYRELAPTEENFARIEEQLNAGGALFGLPGLRKQ